MTDLRRFFIPLYLPNLISCHQQTLGCIHSTFLILRICLSRTLPNFQITLSSQIAIYGIVQGKPLEPSD